MFIFPILATMLYDTPFMLYARIETHRQEALMWRQAKDLQDEEDDAQRLAWKRERHSSPDSRFDP